MRERVRITDVSPRDGLQNEPSAIPPDRKAALVRAVASSGVDEVEVSSFVSPRWIPQLGDAPEVFLAVGSDKPGGVVFSALVPNEQGMDRLLDVNRRAREQAGVERLIDKVSVFTAATESFSRRNTNATVAETIERFRPVVGAARTHGLPVRAYVSCAIRCPFEGDVSPVQVGDVAARLLDVGADEIDLGDTVGAGTPETVEAVVLEAIDRLDGRHTTDAGDPTLTLHLHDTHGRASACVRRALELGVRSFDGSAGGLGGCPFASDGPERVPGNIATGTLVDVVEQAGFHTAVDRARLGEAAVLAAAVIAEANA